MLNVTPQVFYASASSSSKVLIIQIRDASGNPRTGLAFNTANLKFYVFAGGAIVDQAMTAGTVGTFNPNTFVELNATTMPGFYQLCLVDDYINMGSQIGVRIAGASNMEETFIRIDTDLTASIPLEILNSDVLILAPNAVGDPASTVIADLLLRAGWAYKSNGNRSNYQQISKNLDGQWVVMRAVRSTDGTPVTGAAANIRASIASLDTGVGQTSNKMRQTLTIVGTGLGGELSLDYGGASTYFTFQPSNVGTVTNQLNGLSTIGAGGVTVTGANSSPTGCSWTFEFNPPANGATKRVSLLKIKPYNASTNPHQITGNITSIAIQLTQRGKINPCLNCNSSVAPIELGDGWYAFQLRQEETLSSVAEISAWHETDSDVNVTSTIIDIADQFPRVDVARVSADPGAADNLKAFFNGTGYNASTSTIGTVSTALNADIAKLGGDATRLANLSNFFGPGFNASGSTIGTVANIGNLTTISGISQPGMDAIRDTILGATLSLPTAGVQGNLGQVLALIHNYLYGPSKDDGQKITYYKPDGVTIQAVATIKIDAPFEKRMATAAP